MSARLFIRNDDVWTLDKKFCFFFDMAMAQDIPVVHAVIPGKMDKSLIRFLCRAREKKPRLLDIVQHGWMHENHSVDAKTKYEFGASRSLKHQCEDIRQGLKKMRVAFGEHFTPAFVPPYHGYDERTLQVLHEEDFQIFSAGTSRAGLKKRFIELPAEISFSCYEEGRTSIHQARDVAGLLARSISRRPISGVVTHHKDFSTVASRKELARFFGLIEVLRNRKECQAVLFSDFGRG